MKNLDSWARLAGAAADARDALRCAIVRLDRAIAAGVVDTAVLLELRALAVRHADSLKAALKAPAGNRQPRKKPDSWRTGGLWSVLEASDVGNGGEPRQGPLEGLGT
jgi:hypothetical protein